MTNTLADFSSKSPEQQKNPYHDIFAGNPDIMFILKNVVEAKDEIINLLKDEIQYLRDQNKTLINQRNQCCISKDISLTDGNKLKAKSVSYDKNTNSPTSQPEKNTQPNTICDNNESGNKNIVKKKVVIIGDSIIGGINKKGMQNIPNKDVKVKCHPGATTDDPIDHLNPVLRKNPDIIIVHGGTNDLCHEVDTVKNLASSKNEACYSNITMRIEILGICVLNKT